MLAISIHLCDIRRATQLERNVRLESTYELVLVLYRPIKIRGHRQIIACRLEQTVLRNEMSLKSDVHSTLGRLLQTHIHQRVDKHLKVLDWRFASQ